MSRPRRPIQKLVMKLGILGAFAVAGGVSLASFALFGCYCWNGVTATRLDPPPEPAESLPPPTPAESPAPAKPPSPSIP